MWSIGNEDLNTKDSFEQREYLNKELKEMFFALNLIESYGSGIGRAKRELLKNGSPPLKFEPSNETDNYTQAIIKIHPDFLEPDTLSNSEIIPTETLKNIQLFSESISRTLEPLKEFQLKKPEKIIQNKCREDFKVSSLFFTLNYTHNINYAKYYLLIFLQIAS